MNRKMLLVAVMLVISLASSVEVFAQPAQRSFTVSASVPSATSVAIDAYVVIGANPPQIVPGNTLDYGQLIYDPQFGIYRPDRYFVVQVTTSGGAGNPDVSFSYTEGVKPPGQTGRGLGHKYTTAFNRVLGNTEEPVPGHPKRVNFGMNETILGTQVGVGRYLKAYIGIHDGSPLTNAEPFSNADAPGKYDGSILVSVVIS